MTKLQDAARDLLWMFDACGYGPEYADLLEALRAALAEGPGADGDGINSPWNACMYRDSCRAMLASNSEADERVRQAAPLMLEALVMLRAGFRADTVAAEIADAAIYLATGERECHANR